MCLETCGLTSIHLFFYIVAGHVLIFNSATTERSSILRWMGQTARDCAESGDLLSSDVSLTPRHAYNQTDMLAGSMVKAKSRTVVAQFPRYYSESIYSTMLVYRASEPHNRGEYKRSECSKYESQCSGFQPSDHEAGYRPIVTRRGAILIRTANFFPDRPLIAAVGPFVHRSLDVLEPSGVYHGSLALQTVPGQRPAFSDSSSILPWKGRPRIRPAVGLDILCLP